MGYRGLLCDCAKVLNVSRGPEILNMLRARWGPRSPFSSNMFTRTIFTASGASVQTTRYRLTGLCLALIAYSTAFSVPPQALQWRNPLPQGNQLNGITYGRGVFVAVGSTGTILTSTDANEWIYHHVEAPSLNAVSYGDGLFVAVGENGAILTSTNGDQWALRYSPTTNNLLAVTYGNGRFVVAGRCASDYCDTLSDTILVSLDGAKWSLIDLEDQLGYTFGLQAVTYGNSLFVAVGDDGILTSPDGINWARQDWRTCTAVTFSGSAFVASICYSGVLSSDDATNWTYIDVGVGVCLDSIASDGHILVVVGESGTIVSSPDGLSWIKEPSGTSDTLLGVTFGNGVLVAVGENGQILTSADGQSWTSRRTGITDPLFSVAHGNGLFV